MWSGRQKTPTSVTSGWPHRSGAVHPVGTPDLSEVDELDCVTVDAMRGLVGLRSVVADLPMAVSLRSGATIHGDAEAARALLRAMVCQLAVFHGPEHMAIVGPNADADWDWLKWLPHHRHSGGEVGADQRLAIVAAGVATVFEIAPALAAAPLVIRGDAGDECVLERPDGLSLVEATRCARRLARYRPASADGTRAARSPSDWLSLMGIENSGLIEPDERWTAPSGGRILPVPIGVSEEGLPVYLDIKEAAGTAWGHTGCVWVPPVLASRSSCARWCSA